MILLADRNAVRVIAQPVMADTAPLISAVFEAEFSADVEMLGLVLAQADRSMGVTAAVERDRVYMRVAIGA